MTSAPVMLLCQACGNPFEPSRRFGNDRRATHCTAPACQRVRRTMAQTLRRAAARKSKGRE